MSLIGSLSSGVSAMKSFVQGMNVIGNNIANVNTTGFKKQRVNYSDSFLDTLRDATAGGPGGQSNQAPIQVGSGVTLGGTQKLFGQGSLEATGVVSDLAISGDGFFRVYDSANNQQLLTRNGAFRVDSQGYLTDQNGFFLLGLTGGGRDAPPSQIGPLRLDLDYPVRTDSDGRPLDEFGRIVLSDGSRATASTGSSTGFYRSDSEGRLLDADDRFILSDGSRATASADSATGFFRTDSEGRLLDSDDRIVLEDIGGDAARAIFDVGLGDYVLVNAAGDFIDGAGDLLTVPPDAPVLWDPAIQQQAAHDSPVAVAAEYNISSPAGLPGVAAHGSPAATAAEYNPSAPGGLAGVAEPDPSDPNQFALTIQSWSIGRDGGLSLSLNDGSTLLRGQLLLQQVNDPDSLRQDGNSLFSGFQAAGPLGRADWAIGATLSDVELGAHLPNQGGVGFIQSRALESSNVDLTEEFAGMISTQRAFQAGSRIISVSDEMLQEIINLKR